MARRTIRDMGTRLGLVQTRVASNVRPGDDALAILVGSPARIHSTIFAIVKPCAARIASVQPSALAASNSSARRVVTEALPWFFCA